MNSSLISSLNTLHCLGNVFFVRNADEQDRQATRRGARRHFQGGSADPLLERESRGPSDKVSSQNTHSLLPLYPQIQPSLLRAVCRKATRISMRYLEDGSKVRVSKKSGTVIPKPLEATERSHPRPSKPGPSDTHPDDATSETWDGLEAEYARAVNRLRARAEANAIAQRAEPFTGTIPDAARVRAPFGQPRFRLPRPEELERMSPEDQDAAVARYREQLAARRTPRKGWWADQYLAEQRGEAGGEGEGAGGRGEASAPER